MPPPAPISASLDILSDICPMTFVKTKLELEELQPGQLLEVFLRDGEPFHNVTRSCEAEGHEVVWKEERPFRTWRIIIRRGSD